VALWGTVMPFVGEKGINMSTKSNDRQQAGKFKSVKNRCHGQRKFHPIYGKCHMVLKVLKCFSEKKKLETIKGKNGFKKAETLHR